ncbi:acyl carrier protein [Paenibacillus massiliensis]|uniref:acyl carrier protein n=1 Tax=Paenibacillus massiliensis TaxID=225917 RepID=UPI00037089DF|nr:acyl carrier protein [Paenibacillus massiliensis]
MNEEMLRAQVIECVAENLSATVEIEETTDLFQIGINSLTFIRVVASLEEVFDIELDDELILLNNFRTVESICRLLRGYVERS